MEIYLSVGVSTLVALMAAHRADDGHNRMILAVLDPGVIAPIRSEGFADDLPTVECGLS